MTFLLDHDVPIEVARLLRREGRQVFRLVECLPSTSADPTVFAHAKGQGGLPSPVIGGTFFPWRQRGSIRG